MSLMTAAHLLDRYGPLLALGMFVAIYFACRRILAGE